MIWYLGVYILGLVTGIYIGSSKVRTKVNDAFKSWQDKIREKKHRDKQEAESGKENKPPMM